MAYILGQKDKTWQASFQVDKESPQGFKKTITIIYIVKTLTLNENEDAVKAACPPLLQALRGTRLKTVSPVEIDAQAGIWEATCEYDSDTEDQDQDLERSWDAETIEEHLSHDAMTGDPIVNAAGEPILVVTPITIPILRITRTENTFSPNTILQYCNKVNSTPFYNAPAKTAYMSAIRTQTIFKDGVMKERVSYEIKFYLKPDPDNAQLKGWLSQPLNHGTYYREAAGSPNIIEFQDKFLNPTTGNLNPDGTKRSSLLPPTFMQYNRFKTADFNSLQLGP